MLAGARRASCAAGAGALRKVHGLIASNSRKLNQIILQFVLHVSGLTDLSAPIIAESKGAEFNFHFQILEAEQYEQKNQNSVSSD